MSYTNVYPSRINWENEPSIASPINATNLNKIDYAAYEFDQTFATWDITKANQSDLLLSVKSIDYDTETGVFVFTWQNGTTKTVDLNIEKIPVSFSMSAQGVITMTTDDGTTYTADVGSLIKTYTFTDSSEIDFTVTTDASGNKTITAGLVDGSITGSKLEPNYLANCQSAANSASASATAADDSAEDAEAWAVGQRDGTDVPSTDPAYHNNAKWYAEHGASSSLAGLTDVDINTPTDGQVLTYNSTSQKWENDDPSAGGGSTVTVSTSVSSLRGKNVTLTQGTTTLTATFDNSGVAVFTGVTLTGNVSISASDGSQSATTSLNMPYFGNYTATLSFFSATVTVTFPYNNGASCTLTNGGTTLTANTSPMAFNVPNTGTWNISVILDGQTKTDSATITSDGQTVSKTVEFGTINLTFANDFRGKSITCAKSGVSITKTAPSSGNTMVFYPPTTGTWDISGVVSSQTYSTSATISSLSTAVSANLQTIPEGSTASPTDVIQTWLKCAGIFDKNYTTVSQVLADSTTLLALISSNNAVDYMVRSTSWANDICANSTAMTDIGANNYCANKLLANNTWCSAICNSTYFESVLTTKVPTMTGYTTPSGEASASSEISGQEAYKAFDNNSSTYWSATGSVPQYVQYKFTTPVKVYCIALRNRNTTYGHYQYLETCKVQNSDDGTTVYDVGSSFTYYPFTQSTSSWTKYVLNNPTSKAYWRFVVTSIQSGASYNPTCGADVQFYGR